MRLKSGVSIHTIVDLKMFCITKHTCLPITCIDLKTAFVCDRSVRKLYFICFRGSASLAVEILSSASKIPIILSFTK